MRMHPRHLCILASMCLALAFTAAADTSFDEVREYVRIEPRDGGSANQHPLRIEPNLLARALSELQLEPAGKRSKDWLADDEEPRRPLFTLATAHRLADRIAEALREAGPDDDVVFRSVDSAPLLGRVLGRQVFTTGRVFWRNRKMHIIFGGIHKSMKKHWLFGQQQGYVNAPEPGARDKAVRLKLRVVEIPGVNNAKTRDGRKRLDWVIINPRTLASAEPAREPTRKRAAPPLLDRSIEARLKRLEKLYEEGVITEREYRSRRREIIGEL